MTIGKKIGRRLSVREMGFSKETILKTVLSNTDELHFLVRFVGVVSGLRPYKVKEGDNAGETAYGLLGQFEGVRSDGSSVDGSTLYLPSYVNDMIVSIFKTNDDISAVRIAFDVYAEYDQDAATSYVFVVNDLLNEGSQTVDEVKQAIKSLPLPKPVPLLDDKNKK